MNKLFKNLSVILATTFMVACTAETPQKNMNSNQKTITVNGKSGAPITMEYSVITQSPKAGDEIEIQVSFKSKLRSAVKVEVTSAEKLTWLSGDKNWQNIVNKSGIRESQPPLRVIASEDGVYYIHLIASIEENNSIMAKPFTIPVSVGNGVRILEEVGDVVTDEKGQKVIIQKAEEGRN